MNSPSGDTDIPVSVVVPTLGGDHSTMLECLRSVRRQAMDVEILVVDDGSGDERVLDAAHICDAEFIRSPRNLGFAHACHLGARQAHGRYILFLNDDAIMQPGALGRMVQAAERDAKGAVWGPVIESSDGEIESAGERFGPGGFSLAITLPPSREREVYRVFHVSGACMLIRRRVYERIGGFDSSYFAYSEDVDLCWRARLAGWEIGVIPGATLIHHRSVTTRRTLSPERASFLTFRNRWRTILANGGLLLVARVVPLHLLGCLAASLLMALGGRPRSAVAVLAALWWPIGNAKELRIQRNRAQALRAVSDRQLFRRDLRGRASVRSAFSLLRASVVRWGGPNN